MPFAKDFGSNDQRITGNRKITPDADDRALKFGKSTATGETKRLDVELYGTSSANYVKHDASANTFSLVGGTGTRLVGGLVYANTAASTAHSDTTDAADFDTKYSIPAGSLTAGSVVKVFFQGIATATNSTDTLTIALRLGSTTVLTTAAVDVANNNIFAGHATLIFRTVGASGTFVAAGWLNEPGASGATAAEMRAQFKASTSVDTTAALTVAVNADWSVASASNSARLDILTVEIYQAAA